MPKPIRLKTHRYPPWLQRHLIFSHLALGVACLLPLLFIAVPLKNWLNTPPKPDTWNEATAYHSPLVTSTCPKGTYDYKFYDQQRAVHLACIENSSETPPPSLTVRYDPNDPFDWWVNNTNQSSLTDAISIFLIILIFLIGPVSDLFWRSWRLRRWAARRNFRIRGAWYQWFWHKAFPLPELNYSYRNNCSFKILIKNEQGEEKYYLVRFGTPHLPFSREVYWIADEEVKPNTYPMPYSENCW